MKVSIIGATGYGGAELIRLLHNHSIVEKITVHSSSQVGLDISESYPQFSELIDLDLQTINIEKIANEANYVFLATPSGISTELTPKLLEKGAKVIDLSGDFRFNDPSIYESWYKKPPAAKRWLDKAVYGLTEINRHQIKDADLIANAGCFPTATILGLYPLLKQIEIEPDCLIVDAKSGVSGAGRNNNLVTSYAEMNDNFKIYKVNQHQHIPEIEQALLALNSKLKPMKFSTHLVPMTRGIMATIYCKPMKQVDENELRQLYKTFYEKDPFVRVRRLGEYPATKEVYGSNYCDIGITYDERTGWITIVSVIDNLMKGAAGQAIQNMNLMLGVGETTGLEQLPIFP